MNNMAERLKVVEEALSWEKTPYHHQGFVKGAGVDCGFLLIKVFHACGYMPDIDPRPYPRDWHLHNDTEKYLGWVKQYAKLVTDRAPLPGDVLLYNFGKCVSHGAIVIDYPTIIHSYLKMGVIRDDANRQELAKRQVAVYSVW